MKRILAAVVALALVPALASAQRYDGGGRLYVNAFQGTGAGAATSFWNFRVTDGTNFIPFPTALGGAGGLKVECISGSCGSSSFADAAAFTFGTTTVGVFAAVVDDVGTNTVTENSAGAPRMSTNRVLYVDLSKTAANTTALLVTGTGGTFPVTGTFWQATQPVSGTFWQATQPVSGPLTDTQLRATPVPVSGTITANAGTGTFTTDPSDRDARILGRAKIHDGTDTALVSGTGSLQVTCDNCGAPATFADNSAFTFGTTGVSNVGFVFDDVATNAVTENAAAAARITTNRAVHVNLRNNTGTEISPLTDAQLRATPVPVSGTVTVTDGAGAVNVIVDSSALPSGAATSANQSTEITSLQKIDNLPHAGSDVALVEHAPISAQFDDAATTTVTENNAAPLRITSARALHVAQQGSVTVTDGAGALNVIVDSSALPTGAATSALQTQPGVDIGDVTVNNAAGAAAVNIQDGGNSITVDGTVTANAGTGTFTVGDGAGALNTIIDSGTVTTLGTITNPVSTQPTATASALNDGACVTVTTTSGTVVASNASRKFLALYARSTNTDIVYLKLGATATTADFPLEVGQPFNITGGWVYTGVIDSLSAAGSQSVCFVEF